MLDHRQAKFATALQFAEPICAQVVSEPSGVHARNANQHHMPQSEHWRLGGQPTLEGPTCVNPLEEVLDCVDDSSLQPVLLPPCNKFEQSCSGRVGRIGGKSRQTWTSCIEIDPVLPMRVVDQHHRDPGLICDSLVARPQRGELFATFTSGWSSTSSWQPPPVLASEARALDCDHLVGGITTACEPSGSSPAKQGAGSCRKVCTAVRQSSMSHSVAFSSCSADGEVDPAQCDSMMLDVGCSHDAGKVDSEFVGREVAFEEIDVTTQSRGMLRDGIDGVQNMTTTHSSSEEVGERPPGQSAQFRKHRHCKGKQTRYRRLIARLVEKANLSREALLNELDNLPPSLGQCEESKNRVLSIVERLLTKQATAGSPHVIYGRIRGHNISNFI